MALLLQKVDPNTGAVLLDLNGLALQPNLPGFSVLLDPDWGEISTQVTWLTQPPYPGAIAAISYDPIATIKIDVRVGGTGTLSYDQLSALAQQLQAALESGGTYKIQIDGASQFFYMDVYPAPTPQMIRGQPWGYLYIVKYLTDVDGLPLELPRHPYFRWPALTAATNVLINGTLLEPIAVGNAIPYGWVWASTAGLSGHMTDYADQAYQLTAASVSTFNLQQSKSASVGQIWTFAFDGAAAPSGIAQLQPVIEYLDGGGAAITGGTFTGTLTQVSPPTTPPTNWNNRLSVTSGAAPAGTVTVRVSIRMQNLSTTAVTVYLRRAQLEQGSTVSVFRAGQESIGNDITAAFGRHLYAYNPGPVSALARVTIAPTTAAGVNHPMAARISRRSIAPMNALNALVHNVTLGTDTAPAADANATGGTAAVTTPAAPNVMFMRWRWPITNAAPGAYRVTVGIWVDAATEYNVQTRYALFDDGKSAPLILPQTVAGDAGSATGQYQIFQLGTVRLNQTGTLVIEGWASQISGTGTIHWDQVMLTPADEQTLLATRPELSFAAADTWLGSDLESPPSDPAGLTAGAVAPGSSIIILNAVNEAAGTVPDAGIVFPAGTHILSFVGSVFVPDWSGTGIVHIGTCQVWNRTGHSQTAHANITFDKAGPTWQGFMLPLVFVSDGVSAYQFQMIQDAIVGSSTQVDVKKLTHAFAPGLTGQTIVLDGLTRSAYQSGVNAGDVASTLVMEGQFLELAPQSTNLIVLTMLGTPDAGVGTPDPFNPSAKFVPGQQALVSVDVIPRQLMP